MAKTDHLRELSAFLAGIPFFAPLGEATRLEIAGHLEPLHVPAGEVLFRQGDTGDGLYLVASGRLRVTAEADGHERMLYDLGRGAIVGEMALLTNRPRAATVHAVTAIPPAQGRLLLTATGAANVPSPLPNIRLKRKVVLNSLTARSALWSLLKSATVISVT